jgi:predicted transcriptional regulator
MQIDDAVAHYRTATELARTLGVTQAAVSQWRSRHGGRIPELYARRLHELTRGKLRFDREAYGL